MNHKKYKIGYFLPPEACLDWAKQDHLTKAPIWCSVDLRDGNQALVEPMSLDEKIKFFQLLVKIGFKEIEVGFPAASETEFRFLRALIENNMIPDDVTIQVLTQAREHIIQRTFEAVDGAPHAIIHLYNSTSVTQREQVFRKDKEQILKIAVDGAKLLKTLAEKTAGSFSFQYSPESFPETELEYALAVCNAVIDVWKPTQSRKCIINLPTTVENAMPHVFASQVEWMHKNLHRRDSVILCLHPHNDRGSAISDAELGLLAGAERLEGTLFGNGERTGNLDIVTCAMNLYAHGVSPALDFSNMAEICDVYEALTRMKVDVRQPYSGQLVFTAFSGSHQDAIAKGIRWREETGAAHWRVPYLPIDPRDIGREYDTDVIRINSQSGKGGVSYILRQHYGLMIPEKMKATVSYAVKQISDEAHREMSPEWVHTVFLDKFLNRKQFFSVAEVHFKQIDGILADVTIRAGEDEKNVTSTGNGRLDAVSNAIKKFLALDYDLTHYEEHALTEGSSSLAMTYVGVKYKDAIYWGAGVHVDIIDSSISALTVAVNQIEDIAGLVKARDERMSAIMTHIREHIRTVSLTELSQTFYLSTPYLSKLLKEKTGMNFTDIVKGIRLKRARILLKNSAMTVESIAEDVGYQNVENFNRLFKQSYGITPVQFRKEG